MHVIEARNVNDALPQGLQLLHLHGVREDSRDGPVIRCPEPVTTVYQKPCERVLLAEWRDANPIFFLVESLWILAGRNDLDKLTPYVARMAQYSDDGGKTQPAAYGQRMRGHFPGLGDDHGHFPEVDQLNWVVKRLRANPGDRRTVIDIWDPGVDIPAADAGGKDVPCNLAALPYVSGGALHLTVTCRSNDALMGAYGANAVQFSVLLEYLAARIGLPVGTYTQVSNNFHIYLRDVPKDVKLSMTWDSSYESQHVVPYPLFTDYHGPQAFSRIASDDTDRERLMQEDLKVFFEHGAFESATKARWPYLRQVAVPLVMAHQHYKRTRGADRYAGALEILAQCRAEDWRLAAEQWIRRRQARFLHAQDAGANHAE